MSSEVQQPKKFAYGLLDLSKDEDFRFSQNPKVVQQTDKMYHKKPGRKPLANIPDSKRKAQILTAQRAFRERKKYYVEDLEKKVKACESSHGSAISLLQKELLELKKHLIKLETENKALRGIEQHSDTSFGSQRSPHLNSNYSYDATSVVNSVETFRNIPSHFEFTQLADLGGISVSNPNEPILPMSEVNFPPCESTSVHDFPISKPFGLISCLPDTSNQLDILSSNLNSELIALTDSYPSNLVNTFPTYSKSSENLEESSNYLNIDSGQSLYCPGTPVSLESIVMEPTSNSTNCKSSDHLETKAQSSCCGVAVEAYSEQFSEVPCIPKSRDEAALCESLTCVAIGVPATTVSTERLVLELEENGIQSNEASDHSSISKPCSRRKYLSAREVWEKFATNPEFAHLSIDCLCKQLKSKVKVLQGCSDEKMHVIIAEDEVSAAFERLHVRTNQY